MKIIFNNLEKETINNLFKNIGLETHITMQCFESVSDIKEGKTVELSAEDFGIDFGDELEGAESIITVTNNGEEYELWINEDFICEYIELYEGSVINILKSLQNLILNFKQFFNSRFIAFAKRWNFM